MIEIHEAFKSFGDVQALSNVSFSIAPGEIVGFVGVNGSGKSTTMRSILGLITLDSGTVSINGNPNSDRALVSRLIGYMPEQRGLYNKDKINDQLNYFGSLHGMKNPILEKKIESDLEKLGIKSKRFLKLGELSLGNQQRVQLAASMLHDPQYLILDEPFNGLDPIGVDYLVELLKEKRDQGTGILFSSHILPFVEVLCDRIVFIHKGKILSQISVSELIATQKLVYTIDASNEFVQNFIQHSQRMDSYIEVLSQSGLQVVFKFAENKNQHSLGVLLTEIADVNQISNISTSRPSIKEYYKELVESAHE